MSYILRDGLTAWALGALWALRAPWWLSILAAATARMTGIIGFLAFTSWTLNENLYRLLVTQIHSLLVNVEAHTPLNILLWPGMSSFWGLLGPFLSIRQQRAPHMTNALKKGF